MEQDLSALNREAIQAARQYMGHFAWGTVALAAAVLVVFVGNLALFAAGVMPLWAAFVIFAASSYMSYTPVHEAAHGNIHGDHAGRKWVNDLCGYLCAQIIMVPYSTHTVEHFTHHRYTNQPGKDPDAVLKGMTDSPRAFVVGVARFLWAQITFLFHGYWETAPRREKAIYWVEVGMAISWRVLLLSLLPLLPGLVLVVGGYLLGVVFTTYWFAFRPHHPYEDSARYRNTNSLIMPVWMKPLEWFWLGQNLHSIHHAFPRVPFYKYHAVFRQIEPIMRAHGAPVLGIFDRQPVASSDGAVQPAHGPV